MSQSASSADDACGLVGEGDRGALPTLLPRPPVCLLGFHGLPVCGPFLPLPKGLAFSCPFGHSPVGSAWLRDTPSLPRRSAVCPPAQAVWPRCPRPGPLQHPESHSCRNPASRSGPHFCQFMRLGWSLETFLYLLWDQLHLKNSVFPMAGSRSSRARSRADQY